MASRARAFVVPIYLFLCLLLGGSVQGVWFNMFLQLAGLAIIAWAALAPAEKALTRRAGQLFVIIIFALAIMAIQLIPLPASVWPHLGDREQLASGYTVLGLAVPPLPLSLAPHDSLAALLVLIPPAAVICGILRLHAYRSAWLGIALVCGALAGTLVGVLQVSGGLDSPWYIYPDTGRGLATGFFANANHMATLLVVCLPFLAALLSTARGANVQRFSAAVALAGGIAVVILVGLVLNRSLAGYALTVPVLAGSALIAFRTNPRLRQIVGLGSGALFLAAIAALWLSPVGTRSLTAETASSIQSRQAILATSVRATTDLLPFGSGAGTFRSVYQLYEDHDRLEKPIVNHAHNDYVEIALETGLPGIIALLIFLGWWMSASVATWRSGGSPFARAAVIASAAILAHSLVDFPLRTAAISTVFAMCLALLAQPKREPSRARDESELRPTRHMVWE
jgi:O-antigen ligase